jgi:hypothetical protein
MAQPASKTTPQPGFLARIFRRREQPRVTPSKRIADAASYAIQKAGAEGADDAYNCAVITNPDAFATAHKPVANIGGIADATPFIAWKNDQRVPVLALVRADGDVTEVLAANGEINAASAAQIRGPWQVACLVLPEQSLAVAVRATAYPVSIVVTAIPLRGKRTVFGSNF